MVIDQIAVGTTGMNYHFRYMSNLCGNTQVVLMMAGDFMEIFSAFRDVQYHAIDIARELDVIDTYHFHHSINVCLLAMSTGRYYGLDRSQLEELGVAAMLHDIGKIRAPHYIWKMPGKPNEEEWVHIKRHPLFGYEMVQDYTMPSDVCLGILHHHERLNGSGYPFGLKDKEIHTYGKIIAIADVYDAMRSNRSYKEAAPRQDAFNFLIDNAGTHFDSELMAIFKCTYDRQVI
jgi:putative nucleotidyltransferase with HDIG domain